MGHTPEIENGPHQPLAWHFLRRAAARRTGNSLRPRNRVIGEFRHRRAFLPFATRQKRGKTLSFSPGVFGTANLLNRDYSPAGAIRLTAAAQCFDFDSASSWTARLVVYCGQQTATRKKQAQWMLEITAALSLNSRRVAQMGNGGSLQERRVMWGVACRDLM